MAENGWSPSFPEWKFYSGGGSFPKNFQKVGGRGWLETGNAFHRKICGAFS